MFEPILRERLWINGAFTNPDWQPVQEKSIPAVMLDKLCGAKYGDGTKVVWFQSVNNIDFYWAPARSYVVAGDARIVVTQIASTTPVGLAIPNISFFLGNVFEQDEIDCGKQLVRRTLQRKTLDGPLEGEMSPWVSIVESSALGLIAKRVCSDFSLPLRQPQNTEAKKPLASEPAQGNVISLSIDMAKEKCVDLGFKKGTEAYGKCVLQLTK